MPHDDYIKTVANKWLVWITPASRVGGELPLPIPFRTRTKAVEYARACRMKGQRTRITSPAMNAKRIVDNLLEADVPPADEPTPDMLNMFSEITKGETTKARNREALVLMQFKQKARGYIKWIAAPDPDNGIPGPDPADLKALSQAKTFAEAEAILARYDTARTAPETGFMSMIRQGYF